MRLSVPLKLLWVIMSASRVDQPPNPPPLPTLHLHLQLQLHLHRIALGITNKPSSRHASLCPQTMLKAKPAVENWQLQPASDYPHALLSGVVDISHSRLVDCIVSASRWSDVL